MPVAVRALDFEVGRRGPYELVRSALAGSASLAFVFLIAAAVSTHLGDTSGTRAATIAALALGFAIGVHSPLGAKSWLRPALVGLLSIIASGVLPSFTSMAVAGLLPSSGAGRFALTALVALVAGGSAGLVFATSEKNASLRAAWLVGGAIGVIATELVISRRIGVQGALFVIAFTAFLPCLRLRAMGMSRRDDRNATDTAVATDRRAAWFEGGVGLTVGLFVEVARAITHNVMGPAHENWAALAGSVAFALAIATVAGAALAIARTRVLFAAALTTAAATLLVPDLFASALRSWQSTNDTSLRALVKIAFVFVLVAPTVGSLGAAAFARTRSRHVVSNVVVGMAAGMLTARYALHPFVSLAILGCAVALCAAFIALVATKTVQRFDGGVLLALSALLAVGATRFPEQALADGTLDAAVRHYDSTVFRTVTFRRGGSEITVLRDSHGTERIRSNGHDEPTVVDARAIPAEVISGVMPALYTQKRERAFVFDGPGGTSAGAAARLFGQVLVIEANAAARDVLARQSATNFDLAKRSNVTLRVDADPFSALAASELRFDAIVSAMPSLRDVAASKIVSREFLRLAHTRLAPGGVVALAIDERLPLSGLAVVLRTLSDAFAECHFVFLGPEHYEIICSDRLTPRASSSQWPPDVLAALAPLSAELGSDRFLEALILVPAQFHGEWFPAPNSFDLPVLDHVMAREDNRRNTWDLDLAVHFDLTAATLDGAPFDGPRLFERCFALGVMGIGHTLPRCGTMLRAAAGRTYGNAGFPLPMTFLELSVAAAGRDVRSVLSGASLLDELLYANRDDEARALVIKRAQAGTLSATEAAYARRRGLL